MEAKENSKVDVLYKEARTLFKLHKYDAALKKYAEVLTFEPQHTNAQWGFGVCLLKTGNQKEGEQELEKGRVLNRTSMLFPDSLLVHYINHKNFAKALIVAQEWLEYNPSNAYAHIGMARLLLRNNSKNKKKIYEHLDYARSKMPDKADVFELYGEAIWELDHDLQSAKAQYLAALKLTPTDAYLHNNYGVFLLNSGDAHGALEEFRTALRLDPTLHLSEGNLVRAFSETHPLLAWTYKIATAFQQLPIIGKIDPRILYVVLIILLKLLRDSGWVSSVALSTFILLVFFIYFRVIAQRLIMWMFKKGWIQ